MPEVRDHTALLSGTSLNGTPGKGAFYTFSFPSVLPDYYQTMFSEEGRASFRALTETEQATARESLDAFAAISGLTFFEVAPGEGDMLFSAFNFDLIGHEDHAGFAHYPNSGGDGQTDSDVFLDLPWAGNRHVLLHEIGHALGLKHTFEGDLTLPQDMDHWGSSVMSYTPGGFAGDTLASLDIAAIQYLYGAADADGKQVASWSWDSATYTLTQAGAATADTILGVATSDFISGFGGNDVLRGRGGSDRIEGGDGDDELSGGTGNDALLGGVGKDRLFGEHGDDRIEGEADDDTLDGQDGADTLIGGAGGDTLYGWDGNDRIEGGDGNDSAYGGRGDDTLIGGIGNDLLHGQTGLSSINGGDGDDSLYVDYDGSPLRFQVDGGTGTDLFGISILSFVLAPVLSLDTALAAGATLVNVESLIVWGNHFGNRITGSSRKEQLVGGEGVDQLDGAGGDDVLFAGGGSDALSGGADRDYLDGEDGGDALTGGGADDTLVGGAGADRFVYLAASDSTATAYDQLIGFETGVDKIDLGAVAPSSVAWSTTSDGEGRSYNMVTAQSGGGALKIYVHGALAMADFILTQPPRTVIGTSADDVLTGGTGNDRLDGRAGADTMSGGAGDDRYIVDNAGDLAIEGSASGGADSVDSSVAFSLAGQYLENLTLTGAAAIDGTGNGLANVLTGNAAANVLDGGTGGDTMHGGGGNDRYRIDNALDRAMEASASGGTDLVESFVTFSLAGQYLDNLALLGSAAINGTGNGLVNIIIGNAAANVLDGAAGADTMHGGGGNDRYRIDNVLDRAMEASASGGTDLVESFVTFSLAGQYLDNLTFLGSAAINGTGNGLANVLTGNAAANVLDGGAGADTMTGGAGNDRYIVDNAGDRAVETSASAGLDTVESAVGYSLAGGYVDNLTLTGSAAVSGTGNGLANALTGNNAANRLYGGAGNDSLRGNGGADGFHFDSALNGSTNVDRILDFVVTDDTIFLDRNIFKAIDGGTLSSAAFVDGSAAADAADRILYDKASGNIFYDADGTGSAAALLFAQVGAGTALTSLDFSGYGVS